MRVKLLIIYTNDTTEIAKDIDFKTTGSASFPVKLAETFGIPVFNLNKFNEKKYERGKSPLIYHLSI